MKLIEIYLLSHTPGKVTGTQLMFNTYLLNERENSLCLSLLSTIEDMS